MPRIIWQGLARTSLATIVGRIVEGFREVASDQPTVEVARKDAMGNPSWRPCGDTEREPILSILFAAIRELSSIKTPELNVGRVLNLADGRLSDPITAREVPYQWPEDPYADGAEPMREDIEHALERLASLSDAAGTDAAVLRLRAMLRQPSKPVPAMPLPEPAQ